MVPDFGDDHHDGSGGHRPVPERRTLRQLLPGRGCAADEQREGQGVEQPPKCGNKYLGWAFVEAAQFAKRYDERSRRWFDRKAAKTNTVVATKALACKLAKAAWHLMWRTRSITTRSGVLGEPPAAR